jgi:glycosyltransferase involved in cell wall biosynthesis
MKFSIFTPTHNLEHIERPLNSLKNQTFKDFEWVLLLNQDAQKEKDSLISKIKKAGIKYKTVDFFQTFNKNIGYLKRECCNLSAGEILVELDHDDELEPNCLEELAKKFEETEADFVYSSDYSVRAHPDGSEEYQTPFSGQWGWTQEEHNGNKYHPSFAPSPQSFSYIWYAPDHVRAWRKEFYHSIGGHDAEMDICDDFDLLCRTYINGKVEQIIEPLYKYHFHENNTAYGDKNTKIQEKTHELHDKYILGMVSKWCDLEGLKKIDLCSNGRPYDGFTGIDIEDKKVENEIIFDLDKPNWPLKDGSVGVFRCQDAIEHMKDGLQTMKEIHRCLRWGGWAIIEVPSTDGRGAFQDPTHVSFWNSNSFWYYTRAQQAHFIGSPVRFQMNRILDYFPSEFHEFHNIRYTKAHLVKHHEDRAVVPPHGREI